MSSFYISKVVVTHFRDEPVNGCIYETLNLGERFKLYDSDDDEALIRWVTETLKLTPEAPTLKFVTVYGHETISCRESQLRALIEMSQSILDGEESWDIAEEECFSFYLDHRVKDEV